MNININRKLYSSSFLGFAMKQNRGHGKIFNLIENVLKCLQIFNIFSNILYFLNTDNFKYGTVFWGHCIYSLDKIILNYMSFGTYRSTIAFLDILV